MQTIKAIETSYNGYRFRSRTEARWAVFMDNAGIPYVYEPEGLRFEDGTTYLPDFYLPDQDTFLECKGIMTEKDQHKIDQLVLSKCCEVVVGYPDLTFDVYDRSPDDPSKTYKSSGPWLMECGACHKRYFINAELIPEQCRCCGNYWGSADDDEPGEFIRLLYTGHGESFDGGGKFDKFTAHEKAKSARFEFGEGGT